MDSLCERREEMLVSLLYDEGDPQELAEARAHIAACVECRQEYESLIGTRFDVRVVEATAVGACPAVIPEVTGTAHITGRHEFFIDPDDPLREGVLLR